MAARVAPLLAHSMTGSRLRVLSKGGHLNILQEDEQPVQHPDPSKAKGPASKQHSSAGRHGTAEAQGAKEREPGGLGQPCCRASPGRSEQQEGVPGSRAGVDGGRPSTGNRGPEAGPGPQTQRSAARCTACPLLHKDKHATSSVPTTAFDALLVVGNQAYAWGMTGDGLEAIFELIL